MPQPSKLTEKELVDGCIRNDRACQELLYKKYFSRMMSMVFRYTEDREVAMEIVNNGFLRVFKKLDTFGFKGSLEGWIRKLVYHSVSEYFKKHSKYLQFLVFEEKEEQTEDHTLSQLFVEDILKLVETLPPATKEVFRLYAIEGFSHIEISKEVNISIGTSKWHLSTARKQLQQLLTNNNNNFQLHAG